MLKIAVCLLKNFAAETYLAVGDGEHRKLKSLT
jgi:hypothetical protein